MKEQYRLAQQLRRGECWLFCVCVLKREVILGEGGRRRRQDDANSILPIRRIYGKAGPFFIPRTHNSFGDRSFSAAVARVWYSLPAHLRQDMNFSRFQHKLKTFLFGC